NSLNFINELFTLFSRILLTSLRSIIDFEKYINHFILMFLLGGTLALNELRIRRHLNKLLIEGFSESSVQYIVGFAEF
ncbi:hypothetical protein PIROE2DRAFT_25256, partial [Piromyces sp. E2]